MNCYFCSNYSSTEKASNILLTWPQSAFPGNLFPGRSSQRRFDAQNAWNLFERVEAYDSTVRIAIGNENGLYNFPSRSTDTKRVAPPAIDPLWYSLTAGDRTLYREGQRLHVQACSNVNWTPQRSLPLPTAPLTTVFPEYLWPAAPVLLEAIADAIGGVYIYFSQPGGLSGPNGTIINYKYTTDGGKTYTLFSPAQTSSPLHTGVIGNAKNIQIIAVGVTPSTFVQLSSLSNAIPNPFAPALYYDALYNSPETTVIDNFGTFGRLPGIAHNVTYQTGPKDNPVFYLNGSSSYIQFGKYDFGNAFTLSAWIKPSADISDNVNGLIANTTANTASNGFIVGWNSNPRFIPMPSTLKWSEAVSYAVEQGFQLATAAQVREYLTTNYGGRGAFDGDWWAPVADGSNDWIAIGRSYPERAGKLHQEIDNAAYGLPTWGESSSSFSWRGWMPVTSPTRNTFCHFDAGNGTNNRSAIATPTAITYDVWQNFGCVFDKVNSVVKFYINGTLKNVATTLNNIGMNNASFIIGAILGRKYYMKGQVGYIKIYDYTFSDLAMSNEYLNSKARFDL